MAYKALYRTYRPNNFDEVAGQSFIVRTLQNAVMQNKIAHAYLFCGPRGTGKTSIAKIFAKAVNCESINKKPCMECENCLAVTENNHPDIVEIDAASNNGVEEVRNLIEKVKYAPIKGKYKVYIIDEVHMMSTGAFNALLKTIEEPPAHVIFILATTEPHKVIPTIISRCQRFDFTKIKPLEMIDHIKKILIKENIVCEDEVVRIISQLADGGMRDALSILDQCIAYAQDNIKVNHINEIYGITTTREKLELFSYIYKKDVNRLLSKVKVMIEKGIDIKRLTFDLVEILKDCVIYEYTKDETLLKALTKEEAEVLNINPIQERLSMIDTLMESYDKYKFAANVGSYFEVCLLKMLGNNKSSYAIEISSTVEEHIVEETIPVVIDDKENGVEKIDSNREIRSNVNASYEKLTQTNEINIVEENIKKSETVKIEENLLQEIDKSSLLVTVDDKNVAQENIKDSEEVRDSLNNVPRETLEPTKEEIIVEENIRKPELAGIEEDVLEEIDQMSLISEIEPSAENEMVKKDINVNFSNALEDEFVLRLLVGANKPQKQKDLENFQFIDQYTVEFEWAKPANILKNTEILASAEKYIVLRVDNQAEANDINERDSKNEFKNFTKELLKEYKKVFAVPKDQANRTVSEFKNRMGSNTLPKPIEFEQQVDTTVENKEKTEVELVIDLFGENNIVITED